tara:strand:+ start:2363 stop:3091 length:729 start_codon:yes stop_codon:yes gene_type:complete
VCTVSFIPLQENKFIFTSNRDENPKRAATSLHELYVKGKKLFFPQDSQAKGSWFIFSNTNQFVCILNGAFERFIPQGDYRLSRGKMALKFFEYNSHKDFIKKFKFEGMEPFTFIIYDKGTLLELRWDENLLHNKPLSPSELHLWCSSTLYPRAWQKTRHKSLEDWSEVTSRSQDEVMDFQLAKFSFERSALVALYGDQVPKDLPVQTISVSSIYASSDVFNFKYKRANAVLNFEKSVALDQV